MSSLHKILVVGGGIAGLELVTYLGRKLGRNRIARPILLDANITHVWKPLLLEVATGTRNTGEDEVNYFVNAYSNGYEFYLGGMNGLDRSRRVVKVDPILDMDTGECIIPAREVSYDTLVLAVGAVTNDFGTPGVRQHCLCLNNPKEANVIRRKILAETLKVGVGNSAKPKCRIGIVGGGATGVELAAEIHQTISQLRHHGAKLSENQLYISIMEAGNRLLDTGPESLSKFAAYELEKRNVDVKLNCTVKCITEEGFVMDGNLLETDIKIWTAGVKGPEWLRGLGLPVNEINQVRVNENLQCVDDPNIFAMGDCSFAPDGKSGCYLPSTAQVASQQAKWLGKSLTRRLKNRTYSPFNYQPKGLLLSLMKSAPVRSLIVGPEQIFYVEGLGAQVLYSSLYRMHQAMLFGYGRAGFLWLGDRMRLVARPQLKFH